MNAEPKSRSNNFDAIRLFAALLVVYGHAYILNGYSAPLLFANGVHVIGVKIFISLSGYLVAKSWLADPHLGRFLARRALRIFPALILVVLLTTFVFGPLLTDLSISQYFTKGQTWGYLMNIVLRPTYPLPGVFTNNVYPMAVNGSLWSLPVEFSLYLLLPLPYLLFRSNSWHRQFMLVFAAIITSAASIHVMRSPAIKDVVIYGFTLRSWLELAPYFFVGACIAGIPALHRLINLQISFASIFVLACFSISFEVLEVLRIIILPLACIGFGHAASPKFRHAAHFGDLSYGIYLYAFPVQQALVTIIGKVGGSLSFALTSVVAAAFALLSWHLVEKSALRLKPVSNLLSAPKCHF